MPQFVRFFHDLPPLRKHPDVVVKDLQFGTIPVKLYQPKASTSGLRPGIVFYHGGGGILGSLSKSAFLRSFAWSVMSQSTAGGHTFQQEVALLSFSQGLKAAIMTRGHQDSYWGPDHIHMYTDHTYMLRVSLVAQMVKRLPATWETQV